jgi:phosphonate degradation associated HDIG domain protein
MQTFTAKLDEFKNLYVERGGEQYGGEAVSQLQHAVQCAQLAEQAGSSPALIAAAFLHDLGHLSHDLGDDCAVRGVDDAHEYRAQRLLDGLFRPDVIEPIVLHVEAKRCLCAMDAEYHATLSPASVRSMALQGPVFTEAEVEAFIANPHGKDALNLRRWDDLAKDPNAETPDFGYFWQIVCDQALQ